MINRLCQSKKFGSAYEMQTQVFYSILDQVYHGNHPLDRPTVEILEEIQKQHSSIPYVPGSVSHQKFRLWSKHEQEYRAANQYIFPRIVLFFL